MKLFTNTSHRPIYIGKILFYVEVFVLQNELRLKRRNDFRKIYNSGRSYANRELVLFLMENNSIEHFRLGISVSKKIGNAVTRNRVKRLVKEAFRSLICEISIKNNVDIIIIARSPTVNMTFTQFKRSLKDIVKKSKLVVIK